MYDRVLGDQRAVVAFNVSGEERTVTVPAEGRYREAFPGSGVPPIVGGALSATRTGWRGAGLDQGRLSRSLARHHRLSARSTNPHSVVSATVSARTVPRAPEYSSTTPVPSGNTPNTGIRLTPAP